MKCSNCLREIPDGAKSCPYCEVKQDPSTSDPRTIKEVAELMKVEEPGLLEALGQLAGAHDTAEGFANAIFSGDCPACDSPKTETCEDVRGIENILVGRCMNCCALFCTDCGQVFENDVVTISSPACPACGGSNTDFPADEDDDSEALREVVACHDCGMEYCFACGKPLATDDKEEAGEGS